EDGLLYGRGAVDAKGSFCAAVAAASRLPPEVRSSLSLLLIGAVEEEAPSSKGAHHALANYSRPDCLIIGEPSGWDAMTLGYKGRFVARVTLEKDNFHSAGSGPTAAEELVDLWLRVKGWANAFNEDKTGMFDSLQVALQEISSRNDGLMQGADATLGLRLPPTMAPQQAETILRSLLGPASTLTFDGHVPACRAAKDTILSRAFRSAIRQQAGVPRFKLKTGTSDMNLAAQTWDVPMLAYGPGDSTLDHRPDEHLDLAEYERSIRVLQAAFAALAGRA
ncbi:MAG TPA: M20/M25/M40 family metallo-hydrolase, partial [Trueperaceae bacterium]